MESITAGASFGNRDLLQEMELHFMAELNNLGAVKRWIKVSDMKIGELYKILGASQIPSKFDSSKMKTVLELEIGYVSLPARFDNLNEQMFAWLRNNASRLAVMNIGPIGLTYKLQFKTLDLPGIEEILNGANF